MALWLLIPAALFLYLAFDAWRLSVPKHDSLYRSEAESRGEALGGVPLSEQIQRQSWSRRYGGGATSQVVWVWLLLAFGCLAGAVFEVLA